MIQQLDFFFYFRKIQKIIFGVFISLGLLFLNSCGEKEDPLPEGFDFVTDFELIPYDSVFVIWQGTHELNLTPKFFGAFGDEITLEFNPSIQYFIDGKKSSNPPRIPLHQEKEFELYGKIGRIKSKTLKIRVIDVDPKTYVSKFKASMADSTKAPYAISGRSFVDFNASIYDYRGKEFPENEKPDYKFFFDGKVLESLHRVSVLRSGEIPFWVEIEDKKSEVEILFSRELPDLSRKYSLPIIFHIIHSGQEKGTTENPSQEKIIELLHETNEWLQGRKSSGSRKGHNQVDPNLEFFPALIGPDGFPLLEPGINRVFSERNSFRSGDVTTHKYLFDNMWDPNNYANVFIMNIDGAGGFAFYPPLSDEKLSRFYGFTIDKRLDTFTMLHEIGHFLGLPHTFSVGKHCLNRDGFMDTDSYNEDTKKIKGQFKTNCNGEYFYPTNVMDYFPSVSNSFTLDQVNKMRSTIDLGYFLPTNVNPNGRSQSKPWVRGVFDPGVKPIE